MTELTHHEALAIMGLGASATLADLKTAYRRLAAKCHPDLNPQADAKHKFQQINAANAQLKKKLPAAATPKKHATKPVARPAFKGTLERFWSRRLLPWPTD